EEKPLAPCTQGERGGGEGAGSATKTPHPRPLSPEYRGEGSPASCPSWFILGGSHAHHLDLSYVRPTSLRSTRRPAARRSRGSAGGQTHLRRDRCCPRSGRRRREGPCAAERIRCVGRSVFGRRAGAVVSSCRCLHCGSSAIRARCPARSGRRQQHGPGEDCRD